MASLACLATSADFYVYGTSAFAHYRERDTVNVYSQRMADVVDGKALDSLSAPTVHTTSAIVRGALEMGLHFVMPGREFGFPHTLRQLLLAPQRVSWNRARIVLPCICNSALRIAY